MSAHLLRIIVVTAILILINANHSNVSKCKTMSFWQSLKMLCYLPHGLNSTSQKKTKQQNNTPTTLLVCTVTTEDTAWPQKCSSTHLQLYLPTVRRGCSRGWHRGQSLAGTGAQGPSPFPGSLTLTNPGHGSSVPGISPNISFQALLWRASTQLLLKIDLGHLLL